MSNTARVFTYSGTLVLALSLAVCHVGRALALEFPGPGPGAARGRIDGERLVLENEVLACSWRVAGGRLQPEQIRDRVSGRAIDLTGSPCFELFLGDSPRPNPRRVKAGDLRVVGQPLLEEIEPAKGSVRAADQLAGRRLVVDLASADGDVKVQWQAVLGDGANYLRQRVVLTGASQPLEANEVVAWDVAVPKARVAGSVDGSPIVSENMFFACEHPMSWSRVSDAESPGGQARLQCGYRGAVTRTAGDALAPSWVVGVVPEGQLRRGFLYYLERERAQPYRPLLHYNNGSEIGCEYWQRALHGNAEEAEQFRQRQQQVWLENIDAFGRELVARRGVTMDAFAHDFEWDDETAVWRFHGGYPNGFAPAQEAAGRYGASVGVWLSPAGGYPGRKARIESGRRQGLEANDKGLTLAGPRYYSRVRAACTGMIREYGAGYFKFDGFGAGNNQPGAGPYASDVEGLLRLIEELREVDPRVFVNPSTGSWPSPFWLLWADSIWRQGADTNLAGEGPERQRWITYRDSNVYRGVLARGPLYPISSLMIHGVFVNRLPLFGNPYDPASKAPSYEPAEIIAEIRSFFGSGTNLQELYVEPELMTPETWDALAEAAKWARANSDVLVDTHWVGGDPAEGEVYGWASWSPRKAILVLRNPTANPARITLDLADIFELPEGTREGYVLKSPWKEDAGQAPVAASAGHAHTFELAPFEVVSFDAMPVTEEKADR